MEEILRAFENGKRIRATRGFRKDPIKSGVFLNSIDEIKGFFNWAYVTEVYNIEDGIIDIIGESYYNF